MPKTESQASSSANTAFLTAASDVDGFSTGWADNLFYRVEFFYTPTRTRILVYEDDMMTGSTENLVTTLDVAIPADGIPIRTISQRCGGSCLSWIGAWRR